MYYKENESNLNTILVLIRAFNQMIKKTFSQTILELIRDYFIIPLFNMFMQ